MSYLPPNPDHWELIRTASAGVLGALGVYTAFRLARSKMQIVRVYKDSQAVYVVNAGETNVFVNRFGMVANWGEPLMLVMLPEFDDKGRVEPGQRLKAWINPHEQDPPGARNAKHVWVELQSGVRVTSHPWWDLRRLPAKYMPLPRSEWDLR